MDALGQQIAQVTEHGRRGAAAANALVDQRLPSAADRHRLFWDTPCRVFGFNSSS
jgi:predicted TIM-barrel fold metal-dependent hydrolase